MQRLSYRQCLAHILPAFGDVALGAIQPKAVDAWEKKEKAQGQRPVQPPTAESCT
jgi:hypothetical protein